MKTSKHQEEAKKLVGWLSSSDFASGYLGNGNVPVLQSLAKEKWQRAGHPQNYELFYDDSVPMKQVSAPVSFSEVSSIVLRAMSEICVNQAGCSVHTGCRRGRDQPGASGLIGDLFGNAGWRGDKPPASSFETGWYIAAGKPVYCKGLSRLIRKQAGVNGNDKGKQRKRIYAR